MQDLVGPLVQSNGAHPEGRLLRDAADGLHRQPERRQAVQRRQQQPRVVQEHLRGRRQRLAGLLALRRPRLQGVRLL